MSNEVKLMFYAVGVAAAIGAAFAAPTILAVTLGAMAGLAAGRFDQLPWYKPRNGCLVCRRLRQPVGRVTHRLNTGLLVCSEHAIYAAMQGTSARPIPALLDFPSQRSRPAAELLEFPSQKGAIR